MLKSWLAPILWSNLSERVFSCLLLDSRVFTSAVAQGGRRPTGVTVLVAEVYRGHVV